jgi:hypothetical protein
MTLKKSKYNDIFKENIKSELESKKSKAKALSLAYRVKRNDKKMISYS